MQNLIIVTYAGGGNGGDGGPATSVALSFLRNNQVSGVVPDTSGRIYIVERNRVRRVSNTGIITTIAGTGTWEGNSDEGGAATSTLLSGLSGGVAVDTSGNVYISNNNKIQMVTSTGIIRTFAGTGSRGSIGDDGPATSAELNYPQGVAMDISGKLYIADYNKIRMVARSGTITTIAGTGNAGFSGDSGAAISAQLNAPQGVAVDTSGNVFIADTNNGRIRMVTSAGAITTVAGTGTYGSSGDGGPATSIMLNGPIAVAVDARGKLYIAEALSSIIRLVSATGIITTFAGTARDFNPGGYYGDGGNNGDGGLPTSALLGYPQGVAVDTSGNVYIVENYPSKIRLVFQPQPSAMPSSQPTQQPTRQSIHQVCTSHEHILSHILRHTL